MMNRTECYELARNLGWDPTDKEDTLDSLRTNWEDPLTEEEVQMTYEALVEIHSMEVSELFESMKDDLIDFLFDNHDSYGIDPEKPVLDHVKMEDFDPKNMTCSVLFVNDDHWYTATETDGRISIDY